MILTGDSLDILKTLPDNSIDAVVTDPPYGLKFMGKRWDHDVPSTELWREAYRVLKPGGHLLSFGGTRTYHRMVVNLEDAGFEIRDQLQWLFGSGFPKSHDISKAIDKAAGVEREVIGINPNHRKTDAGEVHTTGTMVGEPHTGNGIITAPATENAKQWQGFGTALKPANEPIVLARKPLEKGLTVAENVLKYGTGALNIDGCRIGDEVRKSALKDTTSWHGNNWSAKPQETSGYHEVQGRWPANVILDEDAAKMLDEQSGVSKSTAGDPNKNYVRPQKNTFGKQYADNKYKNSQHTDSGGASRFFYIAKASKRERNMGCEGLGTKEKQGARPNSKDATGKFPDHDHRTSGGNNHPTVKPIKLMQYLCRLITPPGGTVLDPFMGSGSTGVACVLEGFEFVGIELNPEYVEIAEKRIGAS